MKKDGFSVKFNLYMLHKKFGYYLLIAQAILTFLHFLVYTLLINYFPPLREHSSGLLVFFLILSFAFVFFSLVGFNLDTPILRWGYIASAISLVWGFYFLFISAGALLLYLIIGWDLTTIGLWVVGISVGLIIYGLINARRTKFTSLQIRLPEIPEFWKNKTAVVASDLHFGQILRRASAKKIVEKINGQNPDIVFIPGDFFDGPKTNFQALADEFKNIQAPLGSYFCSGNHEAIAGYQHCEEVLVKAGIKILEDQKVEIKGLQLIGLAYCEETDVSVGQRLANIKIDVKKPSILLKHIPSHLRPVAEAGINFQISGHTHLGQVWPFQYITSKLFKGYDYGYKKFQDLQIFTSSGSGTWGPPIRIFTKAELLKITFV